MKTCAVIAEFNPFHNGHAYLLNKVRQAGFDRIIAVMSGNFVQRGEPAALYTASRVEAALGGGADLVIQLPVARVLSCAESFAGGGVDIVNATGVADALAFGSECGDISLINETARAVNSDAYNEKIKELLTEGITYAAAGERALRSISGKCAEIIREPNNILGIEYAAALQKTNSSVTPVTFARTGTVHDSAETQGEFASASQIRKLLYNSEDISPYVPQTYSSYFNKNLVSFNKLEAAVLCKMRSTSIDEIAAAPDISEGIENRIFAAANSASSLDELYSLIKTKRYTHARIRRIVMNIFIGITAADTRAPVSYIRVLGMNDRGAELLKAMKDTAKLPVLSKTADIRHLGDAAVRAFALECRATDIYTACLENALPAGMEKDFKPIKI